MLEVKHGSINQSIDWLCKERNQNDTLTWTIASPGTIPVAAFRSVAFFNISACISLHEKKTQLEWLVDKKVM